jgi:L-ascorbate metabolism protein UlaG (beta-lactamase superfamily)
MKLTYYGHSCFSVKINGKNILFDPFITPNELAKNIDLAEIKPDYILISHAHSDHLADVEELYKLAEPMVVSNHEIISWLSGRTVNKAHPMNQGGSWKFDFGKVKYVNAVHSSSLPDNSYGGNPGGFVIESEQGNFYYSGDTALHWDMKLIGEHCKLDFAVLCIGDNYTMGIDDAIKASDFVGCNRVIGVHYNTFEVIRIDKEEALQKFKDAGKELILLGIGEEREV